MNCLLTFVIKDRRGKTREVRGSEATTTATQKFPLLFPTSMVTPAGGMCGNSIECLSVRRGSNLTEC